MWEERVLPAWRESDTLARGERETPPHRGELDCPAVSVIDSVWPTHVRRVLPPSNGIALLPSKERVRLALKERERATPLACETNPTVPRGESAYSQHN